MPTRAVGLQPESTLGDSECNSSGSSDHAAIDNSHSVCGGCSWIFVAAILFPARARVIIKKGNGVPRPTFSEHHHKCDKRPLELKNDKNIVVEEENTTTKTNLHN